MGALMLTATHAEALPEGAFRAAPVRTGRTSAAGLRNCSVLERAGWEMALELAEAGATLLPPESVGWMHVRQNPIAAATNETLDSFVRRMDASFLAAWSSGAAITLVRTALGSALPSWGWRGRRTLLEGLLRRAADQPVENYELVVIVAAAPLSEAGARAFDLLGELMLVMDPRGTLRLQFAR